MLKSLAFGNRPENKDAYDHSYVWSGLENPDVAHSLISLWPDGRVDDALETMGRDFCDHDGIGPIGAAYLQSKGPDDNLQADVVAHALELLNPVGGCEVC